MRKRHRWIGSLASTGYGTCQHCGTRREVIATIGLFRLRSYVRRDGVRFTGSAPACSSNQNLTDI